MALLRVMLFYTSVFIVIQISSCFQQEHGAERDDSIYDGMTDRAIILSLVKQNEYLVKSVRNLENWNIRQQQDIDNLQTTVRKQQRQLRLIDRMLVSRSRDVEKVSETTASSEHSYKSGPEDGRKGSNHVIPKVGVPSPGKRIVAKSGQAVRNIFEGLVRNTRQSETLKKVAFFTTATNHLTNLGAGQILEFHNVVTNIGNAYSNNTGIFIAPFPGTYVFSASLMGHSDGYHNYYIAKNHNAVSRLHISQHSMYATTAHTVILDLKQGDDVEIRSDFTGKDIFGQDYSCFSGFLLYEDESSSVIVG